MAIAWTPRARWAVGIGILLSLILVVSLAVLAHSRKAAAQARWVAEGQAAVERFLREGAGGAFQAEGEFLSFAGTGYYPPVWNTQGYFYLWFDRDATFRGGIRRIRIYVTEGRITAPGLTNLGRPKIEEPLRISVSHPEVRP